jgi:hypothetical protein
MATAPVQQPSPKVFCCQNITQKIPKFEVDAKHPGSARQLPDRFISRLLSTQPIFQATPSNTNHLLAVTKLVIQVEEVQGPQEATHLVGQPRFFALDTSAGEDDTLVEVVNILATEAGLNLGTRLQRELGTASLNSTGDLRYDCTVCTGLNGYGRSYLVSFWSPPRS